MARSLYDIINEAGGFAELQNNYSTGPSMPQYDGNLQNFLQQYQQVQRANQALNQGSAFARQVDGSTGSRRGFSLGGGTEGLYDSWQKASIPDQLAIAAEQGAEWWNNLPAQIAGAVGGDQAKQDWTFDANKFNLANGFDVEDLNQVKNFALSLPGMMVGGVLEGGGDLYEAATGRPINEYRVGEDGTWEMPNYQLDASQRAADLLDAAINLGGTFTGGAGRVVGGGAKAAIKAGNTLRKADQEIVRKAILGQVSNEEAEAALKMSASQLAKEKSKLKDAVHKQDLLEGMSKGVVTRAVESARGGKELGLGLGLASDMGDEAAEEFVQSYAEDVRNKNIDEGSLDRALTGAAWGAAGGLLMGAGGRALSKVADLGSLDNNKATDGAISAKNLADYSSFDEYDDMVSGYGANSFYKNTDLATEIDERNRSSRRAIAAAVFKMTGTRSDLGVGDSVLGTWQVRKIYEQGKNDAEHLAASLGTDVETLGKIIYESNDVASDLNALVNALPRGLQVVVGRNPDTNNGGFYCNVRGFENGHSFALNPLVAQVLGADWDGDTVSVYFDPNGLIDDDEHSGNKLRAPGYFSEMLINPQTGWSQVDWIWGGYSGRTIMDKDRLKTVLRNALGDFADKRVTDEQGNSETILNRAFNAIVAADKILDSEQKAGDLRNRALSQAFSQVIKDVNQFDQSKGRSVGDAVINGIFLADDVIVKDFVERDADVYASTMLQAVGIDPRSPDAQVALANLREEYYEYYDWNRSGTTGGKEKAFQMAKAIGLLTYISDPNSKYNPIYRQYGGLKFHAASIEPIADFVTSLAKDSSVPEVTMQIIRSAFRLARPGVDPTTAIESMCDQLSTMKIMSDTNVRTSKLKNGVDIERFIRASVVSFSGYSRIYNECQKVPTSAGVMPAYDSAIRFPIDGKSEIGDGSEFFENEFTGDLSDEIMNKFWRQFHRAFDEWSMSELFDADTLKLLGMSPSVSFGDFCSYIVQHASKEDLDTAFMQLDAVNHDLCNFVKSMIRSYETEIMAVRESIVKELSDTSINFSGVIARYEANGNRLDPRDVLAVTSWFDAIYRYIGADNAINLGIVCSNEFIGSAVGKALFSNNPNVRINAICSLSIYAQFRPIVEAITSEDPIVQKNGRQALVAMEQISPMHAMIASSLASGNTSPLEFFTSLSLSLEEKEKNYDRVTRFKMEKSSFIVAALQSETGQFAVSSVSAKNKRADQAIRQMKNASYDNATQEVDEFVDYINKTYSGHATAHPVEQWFRDRTRETRIKFNHELLTMKATMSLTLGNKYVEKGTMLDVYGMLYSSAEITENGALIGKMDELLSMPGGHINLSQFLGNRSLFVTCLSDPNFEMVIYDPDQRANVIMTQEALFNSVPSIVESGGFKTGTSPNARQIMELLRYYPQAGGYLCSPSFNVVMHNGEAGVQLTRDQQLTDDFQSWGKSKVSKSPSKDAATIDNYNKLLENLESTYYNDANAQKAIVAIAYAKNPDAFEGHLDYDEINGLMEEATREYANWQMYLFMVRRYRIESQESVEAAHMISESRWIELRDELDAMVTEAMDFAELEMGHGLRSFAHDQMKKSIVNTIAEHAVKEATGIDVDSSRGIIDQIGFDNYIETMTQAFNLIRWMTYRSVKTRMDYTEELSMQLVDRAALVRKVQEKLYNDARKNNPNAMLEDFSDEARDQVQQAIGEHLFEGLDKMDAILGDEFLTDEDFTSREKAFKSMKAILEESHEWLPDVDSRDVHGNPTYSDVIASVNFDLDAVFPNGVLDPVRRDVVIDAYNARRVRAMIQSLSAKSGNMGINENMVQLASQIDGFVDGSIDYLISLVDQGRITGFPSDIDTLKSAVGPSWGKKPVFRYDSPTLQAMITNQTGAEPAAGNSIVVGVNGSQQKETYALANLPARVNDLSYSYAHWMTKAELSSDNDLRTCFVMIPSSDQPVSVASKAYADYAQTIGDDERIAVLDPKYNPHGLPTWNMRQTPGLTSNVHAYHQLSGAYGGFADFTMEQMVLKLKKQLIEISSLVELNDPSRKLANRIVEDRDYDLDHDLDDCRKLFMKFRDDFSREMAQEFGKGLLGKLNYGMDQALLFTQAMTPGVLLDVTYQDGTKGKIFVDASVLFDDVVGLDSRSKFDNLIQGSQTPVKKIDRMTVEVCTLRELDDRIVDGLAEKKQDNNGKLSKGEREQTTVELMADFSDYSAKYDGDVATLMHKMPYLGMKNNLPIPASDNPVQTQQLLDMLSDGFFGNARRHDTVKPLPFLKKDSSDYKAAMTIANDLGLKLNKERGVTKVFAKEASESSLHFKAEARIASAGKTADEITGDYSFSLGICNDPNKFEDAKAWAMRTFSYLLVPEDLAAMIPQQGAKGATETIEGQRYVSISGQALRKWSSRRATTVASSSNGRPKSSIWCTLVVHPDQQGLQQLVLGDSTKKLFKAGQKKKIPVPSDHKEVSVKSVFGDVVPTVGVREMTAAEAKALLEEIADESNGHWTPKPIEDFLANNVIVSEYAKQALGEPSWSMGFRNRIVDYLASVVSGSSNAAMRNKPMQGECAAMLTDGGAHFAPVFYPSSMPQEITFSSVRVSGNGTISFDYSGYTTLGSQEYQASVKINTPGAPGKGTATNVDDSVGQPMFGLPNSPGDQAAPVMVEIHDAVSAETMRGRGGGMDAQLTIDRLAYMRALFDCNLFFKRQGPGGAVTLSDAIKGWPIADQQTLLSGTANYDNLWNKVINGQLKLSNDKAQNDVIILVLKELRRQNTISPLKVFGNYFAIGNAIQNDDGSVSYKNMAIQYYYSSPDEDGFMDFEYRNLFQNLSVPQLYMLYNAVDDRLCANWTFDNRDRSLYCVGIDGSCYVDLDDGNPPVFGYLFVGPAEILGDYTAEAAASGSAQVSAQHTGRRADDIGYDRQTSARGYIDNAITSERYDIAIKDYREKSKRKWEKENELPITTGNKEIMFAKLFPNATRQDIREARLVSEVLGHTFRPGSRNIYYTLPDGTKKTFVIDGVEEAETSLSKAINRLRSVLDDNAPISIDLVDALAKCVDGVSWSDDMDSRMLVDGKWSESEGVVARCINRVVDNILAGKLPVTADPSGSSNPDGRYPIALMPRSVAQWLWQNKKEYRDQYKTFDDFASAMKREMDVCEEAISGIVENKNGGASRKAALGRLGRALRLSYGDVSRNLPIYGTVTFPEIETDYRTLEAALAAGEGWDNEHQQMFDELVSLENSKWQELRTHLERLGYLQAESVITGSGGDVKVSHGYTRIQEARDIVTVLNNLAETSKVMAIANPQLMIGNIADRSLHQGAARLWQWVGNNLRLGPYVSQKEHIVDRSVLSECVESESAVGLYQAMREMEFTNDEMTLLDQLARNHNEAAILKFVSDRQAAMKANMPSRVRTWAYKWASGGSLGIKSQMKTVVDRFVQFAEADPMQSAIWFQEMPDTKHPDGTPMTRLEATLAQPGGFVNLMMTCLGPNSPSRTIFLEAMNSAKAGDIAQKNAVWMLLSDLCRRIPVGNFLVTTCVSRFPAYGLNVTGRILNYILPMSSMNKCFIDLMSKTKLGKELGIETANIHASMKEAILVDLCKMGVGGCALLLFGISGAIQPPDDERKWGNIDEWLVFGQRAGETWWLEDTLGMALPLACFWKAASMGQPRLDIIVNGAASACYANPMIRISDLATWLINPAESVLSDYNEDVVQFANAKGGPPSFAQYLQANGFSLGMNWLSQFVTPSFLKEWYKTNRSLEKSYKRDWERSASGQITDAGRNGQTEYVTYDEAMKRKLALRNPILAFAFSTLSDKSYFAEDMPNTIYYDDYQLESTNELSVAGLEDADRDARVAYLISVLQSYDDMDELASDGFHLDYVTLRAVADQVWDNYHAVDDWYNSLQADGKLDYYALGSGDYTEGMRIAGELKKERDQAKQYWYNFYYNKLKDSPIAKTIVAYNRYNTTYARDVYGEVYATGIYQSPFNLLPFSTAPGNIENAEGTSGYSNDFTTPSAVTGLPLSQRALIPSESGSIELPDFESLSADGTGNSYSQSYQNKMGSASATLTSSGTSSRTSGSGGSGRSGGGGGGRSSAPNSYGPSTSISKSNASRVMNTDRLIKPDEYYLRPDFETKGSREAYKRSDI